MISHRPLKQPKMYLLAIFVTRQRSVSYVGLKKRVNSVTVQCQVTEMTHLSIVPALFGI